MKRKLRMTSRRRPLAVVIEIMQEVGDRFWARIGQQGFQAIASNLEADAIRLEENCFAGERVHRSDPSVALEEEDPGLDLHIELPARFRGEIDPFKAEMRARDEQGPMF